MMLLLFTNVDPMPLATIKTNASSAWANNPPKINASGTWTSRLPKVN